MSETKERELRECPLWQLVDKGKYLSEYAASIHWDRRKNTKEWMEGLHDAILDYQKMYASLMPSFNDECKMPAPAAEWTTDVPTEEGYYLAVSKFPGTRELHDKTPMTIRVYRYGDTLCVKSHGVITLADHVRMWNLVYFCKINVPALPGEGGSDE